MLFDLASQLTPWGFFDMIMRVMPFVYLSDLPKDIFTHHFFRLASTHHPLYTHIILLMKMNFPDAFAAGYQTMILLQLVRSIKDPMMYAYALFTK